MILRLNNFFALSALLLLTASCFTGIESTPKITHKELKKQNIVDTPERHVLDNISVDAPGLWGEGKRFYIADNRAGKAAWRVEPLYNMDNLQGKTAILVSIDTVPTLTDRFEVQLNMIIPEDSTNLSFRTGLTPDQWGKAQSFTLPHIIETDVVEAAQKKLKGNTYYILSGRRTGSNGIDTIGTRYQPVTVLSVAPETEATPFRIRFIDNEGHIGSVVLTYGDSPTSRRNFETMFSLSNPRERYKNISKENWENIIHSRVTLGMTPDECRLALGSPDNYTRIPTTAGMVERWSYTNGVYLVFEDGLLSAYRQ